MIDISLLEDQIGYKFKNIKFLKIALTHKSYLDENPELMSNQRYEFFGDAILDFDGGLEAVNNFVSNFIYPSIQELSENPGQKDYKTRLQEHYAKQGKKVNYEDQSSGPDHDKNFQTEVFLDEELIGSGMGKSKKASQQAAAKNALSKTNA